MLVESPSAFFQHVNFVFTILGFVYNLLHGVIDIIVKIASAIIEAIPIVE
jgi:hypothetical protein